MRFLIREKRSERGMSQSELSLKSGVSRATLWKIESNTSSDDVSVTVSTLKAIADALDVPISSLFFDHDTQ